MSRVSTNLDMLRAMAVLLVFGDHLLKIQGTTQIGGADINWIGRGKLFFRLAQRAVAR